MESIDLAKAVLNSTELMREIYTDLMRPGVKQVGKALKTVLGLGNTVLLPIAMLNGRAELIFQRNMDRFRESLVNIPEEDIQPVAPEIGVPILEKLTYVSDEALSEMFLNLLAKGSEARTADEAHPAFIGIINSLSPEEARLIMALSPLGINRYGMFAFQFPKHMHARPEWGTLMYDEESFLLDPHALDKAEVHIPELVPAYIRNLERLGLISTGNRAIVKSGV